MANHPIGRLCECGCGRGIDGRPDCTRFTHECARLIQNERKRTLRAHVKAYLPAVNPRVNCVGRAGADAAPPMRQKIECHECCDLPWRRALKCNGCGERYAPEPPIEPMSVIRSSAGTCADHGRMHGHQSLKSFALEGKRR